MRRRGFCTALGGLAFVPVLAVVFASSLGCTPAVKKDTERQDPLEKLSPAGTSPEVLRIGITPSVGDVTGNFTLRRPSRRMFTCW